jgi:hypothetical protein
MGFTRRLNLKSDNIGLPPSQTISANQVMLIRGCQIGHGRATKAEAHEQSLPFDTVTRQPQFAAFQPEEPLLD